MQFLENNETIVNSKRILNRSLRLKIEDEKALIFINQIQTL